MKTLLAAILVALSVAGCEYAYLCATGSSGPFCPRQSQGDQSK